MTAALQVTDTDLARPLKIASNKAKDLIRRELREKANLEGTKTCGRGFSNHKLVVGLSYAKNTFNKVNSTFRPTVVLVTLSLLFMWPTMGTDGGRMGHGSSCVSYI